MLVTSVFVRYTRCMPARNVVKTYAPNTFYHVYNRGVERRLIFLDSEDYYRFLSIIATAVSRDDINLEIAEYCLMPNHFHLLIKQIDERSMSRFMQSAMTRYVLYFNWKHGRVGSLFQGPYKAAVISSDAQLQHICSYINNNPTALGANPDSHPYSGKQYHDRSLVPPWLSTHV